MALTGTRYQNAVAILESLEPRGMKPGLERTTALLAALGNPHIGLSGALVGGTNGKGSVCATLEAVCRESGLRTVMLTKPHLISYSERIAVDGEPISEDAFADLVDDVFTVASTLPADVQPTQFELLTAAGLLAARRVSPDVTICEVGLGGRLDSTNVVDLGVAVITNVGLDHCDQLGQTVAAIAAEKAAIIKPGNTAVTGAAPPALDVIRARAVDVGATLWSVAADASSQTAGISLGRRGVRVTGTFAGEPVTVTSPLIGGFQIRNVATAIETADALRRNGAPIDREAVERGCANVRWPGRMQWVPGTPPMLIDGAHNPPGVAAMVASARPLVDGHRVICVFAAMGDKDVESMVAELSRLGPDEVLVTAPGVSRATPPRELAALFKPEAAIAPDTAAALSEAARRAGDDGVVVVCGSLYLVGEALKLLAA